MKKIIAAVIIAAALTGCAATAYKQARANANQVVNGMTMDEVIKVLGIPPTVSNSEFAYWRRGNAQEYDGTARGAIRYNFKDGRVIGVPEGGIFNTTTAGEFERVRQAKRDQEYAVLRAKARAEEAEKERMLEDARITCPDRSTCNKVFSLAQIYVTTVSDQKIQVVTDTVVQTYNPTDVGRIGMTVVRVPTSGDAEQITITPACKGFANGFQPPLCEQRIEAIYRGFRPYIEVHLGTMDKPTYSSTKGKAET